MRHLLHNLPTLFSVVIAVASQPLKKFIIRFCNDFTLLREHKAWRDANATRRKEAFRQWRLNNKEHDAARKRAWYLANREHVIRKEVERQRRKKLQTKLGDTE